MAGGYIKFLSSIIYEALSAKESAFYYREKENKEAFHISP